MNAATLRVRRLLARKAGALKKAEDHLGDAMFRAEGDDLVALVLAKAEIERVRKLVTRKAHAHS